MKSSYQHQKDKCLIYHILSEGGYVMRRVPKLIGVLVVFLSFLLGIEIEAAINVEKRGFGKTTDGTLVDMYTLTNDNGIEVTITTYEGIVVSICAPDRDGNRANIVLGHATLEEYIEHDPYFGGITDIGTRRFENIVWGATEFAQENNVGVKLVYLGKDEENRPSEDLLATVTYTLTNQNELKIEYIATSEKDTIVNVTNRIYFNLTGAGSGDIGDHELSMYGDNVTQDNEPIGLDREYQHVWRVHDSGEEPSLAARVSEPTTGRVLEVRTNASGMRFGTGNFMDHSITGKGNLVYKKHSGFTLEALEFEKLEDISDSLSTRLKAGETYFHTTVYKFSAL